MWNNALRIEYESRFARDIRGKRVLLVGNAITLFNEKMGNVIDSYDFVIRFGKGYPDPDFKEYLGTKTNAWVFGTLRAGMLSKFKDVSWKLYSPSQKEAYNNSGGCLKIPIQMVDGSWQLYRDYFPFINVSELEELNAKIYGRHSRQRLSQGLQVLNWLLTRTPGFLSINLIGFDFFSKSVQFRLDVSDKRLRGIYESTSWHFPLPIANNPHVGNDEEQNYIEHLPINIIPAKGGPNLDVLDVLLKKLRGPGASIQRSLNL